MPRIFAFFISAILLITGVGFVLYEIFKFLGVSKMSRGRRTREMVALLNSIESVEDDYAYWSPSEIELLSAKFETKKRKKFLSKLFTGKLQTIYGETLMPFAARTFTSNQYILAFKTSRNHYALISTGAQVQAYVGGELFGHMKSGVLIGKSVGNAEVKPSTLGTESIVVGGKDLAIYKSKQDNALVTDRFFEMVADGEINENNADIFTLTLAHVTFKRIIQQRK